MRAAPPPPPPLTVPHRHPGPFLPGRLLVRRNRFLAEVALEAGGTVLAHVADRGRLEGILFPGAEVWLAPAAGAGRKTSFALACARCPPRGGREVGPVAAIDPAGANRLVRALLDARALRGLPRWRSYRPEIRAGASRFDFGLELARGGTMLVEVKSAGVAAGGAALFPDTPSERAARHCRELAAVAAAGGRAAIVLVAQRADVDEIRPHPIDPAFAAALRAARDAGVRLLGVAFAADLDGLTYAGPRPVRLAPGGWP